MRVVGSRKLSPVGLRGPTEDEIRSSVESAEMAPRVILRSVYRYRSHAEANEAMEKWAVDGMVERSAQLSGAGPKP